MLIKHDFKLFEINVFALRVLYEHFSQPFSSSFSTLFFLSLTLTLLRCCLKSNTPLILLAKSPQSKVKEKNCYFLQPTPYTAYTLEIMTYTGSSSRKKKYLNILSSYTPCLVGPVEDRVKMFYIKVFVLGRMLAFPNW